MAKIQKQSDKRMKMIAGPNDTANGFRLSEYNSARLKEWMKKYKYFEIVPLIGDSPKGRRYLEGAVIPEYIYFQYGIDPRDQQRDEARRYLFKRDFNYEIIKDREGNPAKVPMSSVGKVKELLNEWTEWATENGCRIPNPELYKLYRDKWKVDVRFPTFHDFLTFLGLECDAMPSAQTLKKLEVKPKAKRGTPYPEEYRKPTF